MSSNRIKVSVEDDKVTVTSNDINIKQALFSWGSWGTGRGKREFPEFYGRSIESERVHPDRQMWQWDLDLDLVSYLYESMLSLTEDDIEDASEKKAISDVMRALSVVIRGEKPQALDAFTEAYIVAALWSTLDHSADEDGREGENLDDNFGVDDISPEALAKIKEDCTRFLLQAKPLLVETKMDDAQAGHDFWLTRCGHGVGFWARDLGKAGDRLTSIAKSFGECWIEVGDDGQLHGF